MAYVITDLNDFEIEYDDGFRNIVIWKQNIRFGTISGDILPLYYHNKAQTESQYKLELDWNDCTAPVVASAAALQTAIEAMITSGWGGGAGDGGNVISAGGVTAASTGTVVFSNANSISFGMAGNTVTASFAAPAGTEYFFSNANGVTFGTAGSTVTASHNGLTTQTVQPVAFSGSNGSFVFSTLTGGNLNGLSFYTSNGSMVGSYTVPTVTNSSWTASAGTQSATVSALTFADSNGVSFGLNVGTITASHNGLTSQSNQALSGSNGSFTFQTATFGNLNGVSFYTSNGSLIASHNGITSQTVQPVAVSGSNGSFSFSTVTFGNLNGLSFYTSNGSMVGSYTVPAAGGAWSLSAGTTSNTINSLVLSNANGVSFGLNGSTVTASVNAGGADITLSMYPDRVPVANVITSFNSGTYGTTGGSSQVTASYYIASIQVPHPVAFSNLWGIHGFSATSAGTGSATVGHAIGLYSLEANTRMSLVSSFQWQMLVSQNSVTARSHRWYWGTNSNANTSTLNGNVSASFTNAAGSARRIQLYGSDATINAGQYYLASVYTARTSGANVYGIGTGAVLDGLASTALSFAMGEANMTRLVGWNGVFSSTSNLSAFNAPIMPSSIHTSAITISATGNVTNTYRMPYFVFERSIS